MTHSRILPLVYSTHQETEEGTRSKEGSIPEKARLQCNITPLGTWPGNQGKLFQFATDRGGMREGVRDTGRSLVLALGVKIGRVP